MNTDEIEAWIKRDKRGCITLYHKAEGRRIANFTRNLRKAIDAGDVALAPTTPTIKMICRDVDVSLDEGDTPNGFEGLKAAIAASPKDIMQKMWEKQDEETN